MFLFTSARSDGLDEIALHAHAISPQFHELDQFAIKNLFMHDSDFICKGSDLAGSL